MSSTCALLVTLILGGSMAYADDSPQNAMNITASERMPQSDEARRAIDKAIEENLSHHHSPAMEKTAALQRWESYKLGAFVCFNTNQFTGDEICRTRDPKVYNPAELDVRGWVDAMSLAGMRYAVLTTRHTSGFLLWDSATTDFDVGSSGNTTDVVQAFTEECRKQGIAPGLYYCMWGGEWEPASDAREVILAQLYELATHYGAIPYFWIDMMNWAPKNLVAQEVYDLLKNLQPDTIVMMNQHIQDGKSIKYFPTDVLNGEVHLPPENGHQPLREVEGKSYYLPFEFEPVSQRRDEAKSVAETPMGPGSWFTYGEGRGFPASRPFPCEGLCDWIRQAYARGASNVLLSLAPDHSGSMRKDDVEQLCQLGHLLKHEAGPAECVLGNPKYGITGTYHSDGKICFNERPTREWEFMATGTGVTGLTLSFPAEAVLQINHASAFDETGRLRALARIHLDLDGAPFVNACKFSLEHDLWKSVITALAETSQGSVQVQVRAHVPHDVIRIDIEDGRDTPGRLTLRLEEDALCRHQQSAAGGLRLWHENPETGSAINEASRSWLAGRTFGLNVFSGQDVGDISERTLELPAANRHTLYVAGASVLGGAQEWSETMDQVMARIRTEGDTAFLQTHEAWWDDFWGRSHVTIHEPTGRMTKCQAAFDLYRYYLACCGSDRRETPVRFQIDLFRYHTRFNDWMAGLICAVEQYQSFYGALRTGYWEGLRGLGSFYKQNLPQYRDYARQVYDHEGARIPMWTKPPVLSGVAGPVQKGVPNVAYNGDNPAGALWVLALLSDYVKISCDTAYTDATLFPLAVDLIEFIRLQYPPGDEGRMMIAPCNAGETWQGVRDPAEMVCALRTALPRLIALGQERKWKDEQVAQWKQMLETVPDIPRGRFEYRGHEVKPAILAGDQLVPAADMSNCQAYMLPWSGGKAWYELNGQQTEMYAVWPGKLVLQDEQQRDAAVRSYRDRLWKNKHDGWNPDVVFAACLGMRDEVAKWHDQHFDGTFVLPCGLARETAQENPQQPGIPECPSLQGLGTGVIPILEMLLQDYPDEIIVLPCWPEEVPVDFALYSPYAGHVEVHYHPQEKLLVATERAIAVRSGITRQIEFRIDGRCEAAVRCQGNRSTENR